MRRYKEFIFSLISLTSAVLLQIFSPAGVINEEEDEDQVFGEVTEEEDGIGE